MILTFSILASSFGEKLDKIHKLKLYQIRQICTGVEIRRNLDTKADTCTDRMPREDESRDLRLHHFLNQETQSNPKSHFKIAQHFSSYFLRSKDDLNIKSMGST